MQQVKQHKGFLECLIQVLATSTHLIQVPTCAREAAHNGPSAWVPSSYNGRPRWTGSWLWHGLAMAAADTWKMKPEDRRHFFPFPSLCCSAFQVNRI